MHSIAVECDRCGTYQRYPGDSHEPLICSNCHHSAGQMATDWSLQSGCPLCACRHLYRRKDFNQLLGLLFMIIGATLAIAFSYWFLLLFGAADLLLYRMVSEVAVCHRCGAELRGAAGLAELPLFDHHTADIYQDSLTATDER